MPSHNESTSEIFSLDVIGLLRRKFWFILFFILLATALGVLYFFQAPKTFASYAKLAVDEQQPPNMNVGESEYDAGESPVEYYIEAVRSTTVISDAIDTSDLDDLDSFEEIENPVEYIKKNLVCKPADTRGQSGVMRLTFNGPNADDCKKVLDAVVNAFERFVIKSTENSGGEMAALVKSATDGFSKRYDEVQKEIADLAAQPHLMMKDGVVVNPHQMQQLQLHEELNLVQNQLRKLVAQVDNIEKSRDQGIKKELLMMEALQEINEGTLGAYVNTHTKYVQLRIEEMDLINQFAEDHPKRRAIREQIKMVNELRMEELAALRGGKMETEDEERDFVELFINYLKNKISILKSEAKSLEESIADEHQKHSQIARDVENLETLRRERERLEAGQYTMFDQLKKFDAMKAFQWRNLQRLDEPSSAAQVSPSLLLCIPGGFLLGTMFGLFFAGVKEFAEKTFRSSEDVATQLDSRVIAHVQIFNRNSKKDKLYESTARELVTLHQPLSQASESFRAIRTSMFFKKQNDDSKVFQITSPTPGDGKSTTIANVAALIAQSNRKVVLIDADFRKPKVHGIYGLENKIGMSSVLTGERELPDVIQTVENLGLDVIPCGPIPPNPAELLTEGGFSDIVEVLREKYDFVLIDSPPLLAVSDPSIIANFCDSTVLVLRIKNGVKIEAMRAKEVLESVDADLTGVVINGLRRKDERYYNYGGQYGYRDYGRSYRQAPAKAQKTKRQDVVTQAD